MPRCSIAAGCYSVAALLAFYGLAMTPYYEQDGIVIYHGDCRDVLPSLQILACLSSCHGSVGTIHDRLTGPTPKTDCETETPSEGIESQVARIAQQVSALQGSLEHACERL